MLMLFCPKSHAQYADLGGGAQTKSIWWLNWAGFTLQEGASRTFNTNEGLTVQVTFSNVSQHVPVPFIMDTYGGSLLYLLYNFSDPTVKPALYDQLSSINFNYTLTITASRNGLPVPFTIVTADAEASFMGETSTLQTNGGNWQTIEFYRNSTQINDPLAGCGTQTVAITNTYDGSTSIPQQIGQCPVISTQSPATGPLVIQTNSDHGGTLGGMALAFGVFESVDRGDLPLSYGTAWHKLLYTRSNPCNFNPPYPTLNQITNLHIGLVPGDPDPIQYDNDDSIGVDEEGVSTFPAYNYNGSYSVNVVVTNTTGAGAWLTGWFDFNRDGTFEPGESVTALVPNNAASITLTWTGLPPNLPQGAATGYGFRFRISSDQLASQNATGYAPDGEVEDYFVPSPALCSPFQTTITPDQTICSGQTVNLQASGASTYAWTPSTGLSNPAVANPIASPVITTQYTVTASNLQGCPAAASMTVNVNPSPVIAVDSQSTTICAGHQTTITAFGAANYSWATAGQPPFASTPSITVSPGSSTKYYVIGYGTAGCNALDSANVIVQPVPVFSAGAAQAAICKGDSVLLTASGGDQYSWYSGASQSLGNTPSIVVSPFTDSDYQVLIVNDLCQLTQTLTVPVTVEDLPQLQISSSNDITCTIGQATLQVTGGISYQWIGAGGISNPTSPDQIVSPSQTTTYYVRGTGSNGCSSLDSITVKVNFSENPSRYPVASAFTPNNDGNNDCFGLKYWGQVNSLAFSVYDRWGTLVFTTRDPQGCWDGTFKGTPQPAGTYVYQIKATTPCGIVYRKGTVMLIR